VRGCVLGALWEDAHLDAHLGAHLDLRVLTPPLSLNRQSRARARSVRLNRSAYLTFCSRMIFCENRFPLFGIMR
jgi:hypothetical protein